MRVSLKILFMIFMSAFCFSRPLESFSKKRSIVSAPVVKKTPVKSEGESKVSQEANLALQKFYRYSGDNEVFIPDWQGNGEWVSVSGGSSTQKGLSSEEIRDVLGLFGQAQGFKPKTSGVSTLAAITCYWKIGAGTDHWTARGQSSTGVPLKQGIVAVDPEIIPYGSLVMIEGVPGAFVAADCGSHVRQRVAVQKTARTLDEKKAVVIDVYFVHEKEGKSFDGSLPKFVKIHYFAPTSRRTS
jgi:3D (Asp-Asp-Asp) domain-containing protein